MLFLYHLRCLLQWNRRVPRATNHLPEFTAVPRLENEGGKHRFGVLRQHLRKVDSPWFLEEEVVVERTVRVDSFFRVKNHKTIEQVKRVLVAYAVLPHLFLDLASFFLPQFYFTIEHEGIDVRPDVFRDRTAELADELQLLRLAVALQDRSLGPHLSHSTPSSPHVDRRAVVAFAEQQFRRTVPYGDDGGRVAVDGVRLVAEGSRQSEIGDLEDARLRDEDVGRLQVAVEYLVEMHKVETVEQLVHHLLDLAEGELDVRVT